MKLESIIILFIVCFGYVAKAQDATVTMSMSEYERVKARIDSLTAVIVNDKLTVDSLNNSLKQQDAVIGQLRGQIRAISARNQGCDSVIEALKDSLAIKSSEIARFRDEVAYFDIIRFRYANGRLLLPYDQEKVDEAIELFNGISDENLRNEFSEVLLWLSQYDFYLQDVKELIQSIQSDTRRENKFQFDEWRASSLNEIKHNKYVRAKQGHKYTILYLDDILTIAQSRLTKATNQTVDFSDLIERLQL